MELSPQFKGSYARRTTFTAKKSSETKMNQRRTRSPNSNDGHASHRQRFSSIIQKQDEVEIQVELYDTQSENELKGGQEAVSQPIRSPNYLSGFSPNFMTQVGSGVGSGFFGARSGVLESATSTDMSVKFPGNDNVKVCIRVRPFVETDQGDDNDTPLLIDQDSRLLTIEPKRNGSDFQGRQFAKKRYSFDMIADDSVDQEELFDVIAKPIATNCLEGVNGCIFAYGQTGAGKTHTIQGDGLDQENRGMLQRSFEYLFEVIEQKRSNVKRGESNEFTLKCTYFEIYNEHINDLLHAGDSQASLHLREDSKRGVQIIGITTVKVENYSDVIQLLEKGTARRKVASTKMNEKSSRSHSVLSCFIESKSLGDGMLSERFSTFHIIDLAGSESNKSSMAEGVRLKESGMINKSLSALGLVIKTLSERKNWQAKHVPYRSSKLTFILKNSLGGNSKTLVIANVSPSWSHLSETLSTLDFAKRAKLMKNEAQVNDSTTINVRSLQNEIMKLKSQVFGLQQQHHQQEERKESVRSESESREEETSLCVWDEDMLQMKVQSKMLELSIKESLVSMKTEEDYFNQAFQDCPKTTPNTCDQGCQVVISHHRATSSQTKSAKSCQKMTQTALSMSQEAVLNQFEIKLQMRKQQQYSESNQNPDFINIINGASNQINFSTIKQQIQKNKNVLIFGATQNTHLKNLKTHNIQHAIEQLIRSNSNRILIVNPMDTPSKDDLLHLSEEQDHDVEPFERETGQMKHQQSPDGQNLWSKQGRTPDHKMTTEAKFESINQNQTMRSSCETARGSHGQQQLQGSFQKLAEFDATFSKVDIDLLTQVDFQEDKESPRKFVELLQQMSEDRSSHLNSIKDTNEDLENFADNLVSEVNTLKITIGQRNQMIEKLEDQLQTHEVFQDLRELKEENEKLQAQMESEAREYLEQIKNAEQQKDTIQQNLDDAIIENFKLKNELIDRNTDIENKNIISTQLESIINDLNTQLEDQTLQIETAMMKQNELNAEENLKAKEQIRALQDEIQDLKVQNSLYTSRSKRMSRQNEELTHRLAQSDMLSKEISFDHQNQYSAGLSKVPPLKLEAMLDQRRVSLFQEMEAQEQESVAGLSGSPRFEEADQPFKGAQSQTPSLSENENLSPDIVLSLQSLQPVPQVNSKLESDNLSSQTSQSLSQKSVQSFYNEKISGSNGGSDSELQDVVSKQIDKFDIFVEPIEGKVNDQVSATLKVNMETSRLKYSSISASGYDNSGFFEGDDFRSFARSMESKKDDSHPNLGFITPQYYDTKPQIIENDPRCTSPQQSNTKPQIIENTAQAHNNSPYMTCSSFKQSQQALIIQNIDLNISIIQKKVLKVDTCTQIEQIEKTNSATQIEQVLKKDKEVSVKMKIKSRHVGIQNKFHTNDQLSQTDGKNQQADQSSQYELEVKNTSSQHIPQIQDQASMCGGPPRRSRGTNAEKVEQISQYITTDDLVDSTNACTETITQTDHQSMQEGTLKEHTPQTSEIIFQQSVPHLRTLIESHTPSVGLSPLALKTQIRQVDVDLQQQEHSLSQKNVVHQKHTKTVQNLSKMIESLKSKLQSQIEAQEELRSQEESTKQERKAMVLVIDMYKKQVNKIENDKKQFQISLSEMSNSKAMSFDVGVDCRPDTSEASISCRPLTKDFAVSCLPQTLDSSTSPESPPLKSNASTLTESPKTKDSSTSPSCTGTKTKNKSSSTVEISQTTRSTQKEVDQKDHGTSTFKLTQCDSATQHKQLNVSDKGISCSIRQQVASVGVQCAVAVSSDASKKMATLQKQNDDLEARLADKSFQIKENKDQIINLRLLNDSYQQESNRSQMSTDRRIECDEELLSNLQNQIQDQQKCISSLEHQISKKSPKSNLLEDGLFKDSDNEEVKDLKKEMKVLEKQLKQQLKDMDKQKQDMYKELMQYKQKKLSHKIDSGSNQEILEQLQQEKEKNAINQMQLETQAKNTQELINNTLKMKAETQKMEQKHNQLQYINTKKEKDMKLMVEINVQQKLINNSIWKQNLEQNSNVSLQTILEEEIESQLNNSHEDRDLSSKVLKDQISNNQLQIELLNDQIESLSKRFKYEVETSSRNAKYFLQQNQKAEVCYTNLVHEYNIVRQEKFEKEKELIQIKINDNILVEKTKQHKNKQSLRRIRSSQSQVACDDINDLVQIKEIQENQEYELSDSDDDETFKSSFVLEGMGSKTQKWLYKNQQNLKAKNPLKRVIKDSLIEKNNQTPEKDHQRFYSSDEEVKVKEENKSEEVVANQYLKESTIISRRQMDQSYLNFSRGRSLHSSVNTQSRGHSLPKLSGNQLDFTFNVVHQEVFVRAKLQTRHQPTMRELTKPLRKIKEVRDDLEHWVSTNCPYQEFNFAF